MIDNIQFNRIAQALPFLQLGEAQLVREFKGSASYARIPAGHDVFVEGDPVDTIALLLSGVVRVYKISETGREITLYRFGLGEACVLTANAILSKQSFPAIATVEQAAEAVIIPAATFRTWVGRYEPWRSFVFDLLSQRLAILMAVVEEVAFRRMDVRLAKFLAERGKEQNPIPITHQEIAAELGSSREVISRILEDFASLELVRPMRGALEVTDLEGLENRGLM